MTALDKDPRQIRGMFSAIAPRYDLLNHLLSMSIDRYWRRRTLAILTRQIGPGRSVLDLCTGTGDLALLLARRHRVIGCDFAHPMLLLAAEKAAQTRFQRQVTLVEADALSLPFASKSFDAVTIAFGLRNLADYEEGLREMARVLRPGGVVGILEFSQPTLPVFRQLYFFYFSRILPKLGEWISGKPGAYSYLCRSVREFPPERELEALTRAAGLHYLRSHVFSGGIAGLYLAERPQSLHRSR
jgi:demethylmenaquinone methyltransferase / 2-methoxy-6-polyprenyl-1,4-benzoquinol methylase